MIQKILGAVAVILLVVAGTLAFQLHGARSEVSTLTSDRDAAKQEARNAKQAQIVAETQNALLAGAFKSLDTRLVQLGDAQKANNEQLILQIEGLSNIQKSEGDDPNAITCLDTRVPAELDKWLLDSPYDPANGHH